MGNRFSTDSFDDSCRRRDPWDECLDSDDSNYSSRRTPTPPPKKPKIELKYGEEDPEDETDCEIQSTDYKSDHGSLALRSCFWPIHDFSYLDLFEEKGYLRSRVYRAGDCNQFQFYFIMKKLVTENDTHFGVYVCVLSDIRSEASVYYKSFFIESRGHKYNLNSSKSQKFPRKPGFRFLGSLSKSRILDDDYWNYRFVPEGTLTLYFKINVCYKHEQSNDLEKLIEDNQMKNITLVVKGEKFRANKSILKERSPTFAKLLAKDKKLKKLEITGVDPAIMKQLLMFMYTGYVSKLFTYAEKLSTAADKYKLKDLKAMCKKVRQNGH